MKRFETNKPMLGTMITRTLAAFIIVLLTLPGSLFAQQTRDLQNYRQPDRRGVNVFEAPKDLSVPFQGLNVRMGGAFALQLQGLSHENNGAVPLIDIGTNFNLATANMDMDVALEDGLRMHLRTFLSSRHHPEPYVKSGYFQVDKLDFIQEGLLSDLMEKVTVKVGHMEVNYGDAHFRRSDNAAALYNPFVGNFLMDSFTTEVAGEVYYKGNGLFGMVGLTNGKLNQSVADPGLTSPSLVGKLGYDNQVSEDLRVRVAGSVYSTSKAKSVYLYAGDRAGGRYYLVLEPEGASTSSNFRSGRFDPGFKNELTAIMLNTFVKFQGLEFFGLFENSSGKASSEPDTRTVKQFGAELLYRLGANEDFYVGGRYNLVSGDLADGSSVDVSRINIGGGWFLTDNVMTKVEYVSQTHKGYANTSIFADGKFSGIMIEAVIGF
jgi:hypothetical protein